MMTQITIPGVKYIELPKIVDPRGSLSFIESNHHIPFEIKRVYYLYDIPAGAVRAGHAHKTLHQFLLSLSGSMTLYLDDGQHKDKIFMNQPNIGIYIPPLIWRELHDFTSGAVCLAVVSDFFNEADYIRDYHDFIKHIKKVKR